MKKKRKAQNPQHQSIDDRRYKLEQTLLNVKKKDIILFLSRKVLEFMRSNDVRGKMVALEAIHKRTAHFDAMNTQAQVAMNLALSGVGIVEEDTCLIDKLATSYERKKSNKKTKTNNALFALCGVSKFGNFFDVLPLEKLWEYSASVPKVMKSIAPFVDSAWPPKFKDMNLPLLIDVGCGFGASALAFASTRSDINVLGCDRAYHALQYGKGIAKRRNLTEHCQFVVADGRDVLLWARELYCGPISHILLQFPTPYKLLEGKNSQLPSRDSQRFMLNDRFLKLVVQVAKKSKGCFVVHSSNVEDVAVTVRESLTKLGSGFCTIIENEGNEKKCEIEKSNLPLRTKRWIESGGKRAHGAGWLNSMPRRILPVECRTETEAYYKRNNKAVFRFVVQFN
eukprot:g917.t1